MIPVPHSKLQSLFDRSVRGLASQGFQFSRLTNANRDICAYRGDNGCKCAIGHLIPDADYSPMMEGERGMAFSKVMCVPFTFGTLSHIPGSMWLSELQECHDDARNADDMVQRLRRFAVDYRLTWPEGVA